jgi:hypothetical protein
MPKEFDRAASEAAQKSNSSQAFIKKAKSRFRRQ